MSVIEFTRAGEKIAELLPTHHPEFPLQLFPGMIYARDEAEALTFLPASA